MNWADVRGRGWADPDLIRTRLAEGADPDTGAPQFGTFDGSPLHLAAQWGSPEVVAELIGRVADVDAMNDDRTALWVAVFHGHIDIARLLITAGAEPWRPMMSGWAPGRLALAGPVPDLFPSPPDRQGLSTAEMEAVAESRRLIEVLAGIDLTGFGVTFASAISSKEAIRRLDAALVPEADMAVILDTSSEDQTVLGLTDVPGGCVLTQPWGATPTWHEVIEPLCAGATAYGVFVNPGSGSQGVVGVNGVIEDSDTHPGGGDAGGHLSAEEILAEYLYQGQALAYCCAAAGLRPIDARAVTGPPDHWIRVHDIDF